MRAGIAFSAVLAHSQADAQVFLDREMRKNLAPLRNISDADTRAFLGAAFQEVSALESDAARGRRKQPHDAFQQRGLAHAVAAHQAHARARRHRQVHIPQGVAATVELIECLDRQHAVYAPR